MGKAASCVFHLEGCAERGMNPPSRYGFLHRDLPQIAADAGAGSAGRVLAQMLAFAALVAKRTSLAPRAVSAHT